MAMQRIAEKQPITIMSVSLTYPYYMTLSLLDM